MVNKLAKTMGKIFSCIRSKDNDREPSSPLRRKMVIVGDGECGKTCLVTRMCSGEFVDIGYLPTVFETEVVNVNTGKESVDLTIFDTAGQEDYDRLRPFSYHDADIALICFSLADTDTLTNVTDKWSPEVKYFCGNIPIILVGNKKDLREPPTINEIVENKSLSSSSSSSSSSSENVDDKNIISSRRNNSIAGISIDEILEVKINDNGNNNNNNNDDNDDNNMNNIKTNNNNIIEDNSASHFHDNKISSSASSVRNHDVNRVSHLYEHAPPALAHSIPFHVQAPVKHSEGTVTANRIGAIAYFETSALRGDNVEELLLATTKGSVLGSKKSKSFKPFVSTLKSWKSMNRLEKKSKIP